MKINVERSPLEDVDREFYPEKIGGKIVLKPEPF